jgi:hypothetical protein
MSNYFIMNIDINTANELEIMKATKGKGIDLLNKRVKESVENDKKPINPKTIFEGINKSKIKNSKYRQNKKFQNKNGIFGGD